MEWVGIACFIFSVVILYLCNRALDQTKALLNQVKDDIEWINSIYRDLDA